MKEENFRLHPIWKEIINLAFKVLQKYDHLVTQPLYTDSAVLRERGGVSQWTPPHPPLSTKRLRESCPNINRILPVTTD